MASGGEYPRGHPHSHHCSRHAYGDAGAANRHPLATNVYAHPGTTHINSSYLTDANANSCVDDADSGSTDTNAGATDADSSPTDANSRATNAYTKAAHSNAKTADSNSEATHPYAEAADSDPGPTDANPSAADPNTASRGDAYATASMTIGRR